MSNNFDDLSDDFLGEGKDKKKSDETNRPKGPTIRKGKRIRLESEDGMPIDLGNLPKDLPPEIIDLIKSISEIKERGASVEDEFNLGEPDEHESHDEDGNTIDKSTWNTDFGSITRISIGGEFPMDMDPSDIINSLRNKFGSGLPNTFTSSPEEELQIALENEDYLEAARLRDIISDKNKKSEKQENIDKKGNTEGSIWDLLD